MLGRGATVRGARRGEGTDTRNAMRTGMLTIRAPDPDLIEREGLLPSFSRGDDVFPRRYGIDDGRVRSE